MIFLGATARSLINDVSFHTVEVKPMRIRAVSITAIAIGVLVATSGLTLTEANRLRPGRDSSTAVSAQVQDVRGLFRVTLNGFTVIHETKDDPLEGDGRRDEVYIVAEVWTFDKDANTTLRRSLRSAVMGDNTNRPERVPAGSAQPGIFGGQVGGLRTGDSFPTREPWRRASAGFGNQDRPPMKLWEGELVRGQNVVALMPTIWEWDSTSVSEIEAQWTEAVEAWLNGFHGQALFGEGMRRAYGLADNRGAKPRIVSMITNWRPPAVSIQTFGLVPFEPINSSLDGNRPIGITNSGRDEGGLRHVESLTPSVLALTYDSAQYAIQNSPSDKGPGIFEVSFRDSVWHENRYIPLTDGGAYRLYLQVERVR